MTATSAALKPPAVRPLPRSHEVVALDGGRYLVKGVPIFAEHTRDFPYRGPKGEKKSLNVAIGLGWLKSAALNMRRAQDQDGFRPPAFVGHHDPDKPVEERPGVGEFRDPYLVRALFKGRPTWVLCADLEVRSAADLETLRRHPYRSVEADLEGEPSIRGLALMASQPPFFPFPNLELQAPRPAGPGSYAAPRGGVRLVWSQPLTLRSQAMPIDDMEPETEKSYADDEGVVEGVVEGAEHEAAEGAKLDQILAAIMELKSVFMAPVGAQPGVMAPSSSTAPVMAASAKAPAPVAKPAPAKPAAPKAAKAEAPKAAAPASFDPAEIARLVGSYAAAERSTHEKSARTKTETEVLDGAIKALSDRPISDLDAIRSNVLRVAYAKGGEPAVALTVEMLRAALPSLPGPADHSDPVPARTASGLPPEVAAYSVHGDEALAAARGVWGDWQRRHPRYQNDTLADYLKHSYKLRGLDTPSVARPTLNGAAARTGN